MVPFGWARFEIRETPVGGARRAVFAITAEKAGKGVVSELDHTRAE
jgi:hypothetical protein